MLFNKENQHDYEVWINGFKGDKYFVLLNKIIKRIPLIDNHKMWV